MKCCRDLELLTQIYEYMSPHISISVLVNLLIKSKSLYTHITLAFTTFSTMADPGEKSLEVLLSTLTTTLHPTTYVFATLRDTTKLPPISEIQLFFRESEGITVIVSKDFADAQGIEYFFPCKMITLNVTSSLEAVGFMAVLATRLATKSMGVNPVSGFYHDHLFVPLGREEEAVEELKLVAEENRKQTGA